MCNKAYGRLTMKLDIDKIKENLKTSLLGQNIIYREEIESTQQ